MHSVGIECTVVDVVRNRVRRSAPAPAQAPAHLGRLDQADPLAAVRVEHPHPARAGGPDVAELVALHAVG